MIQTNLLGFMKQMEIGKMKFGIFIPNTVKFSSEHLNVLKQYFDYIVNLNSGWAIRKNEDGTFDRVSLSKMRYEKDDIVFLNHGVAYIHLYNPIDHKTLFRETIHYLLKRFVGRRFLINKFSKILNTRKNSKVNVELYKKYSVNTITDIKDIESLRFPIIAKPINSYKSKGIFIIEDLSEFPIGKKLHRDYIFQEYIPFKHKSHEYRLIFIGDEIANAVKREYIEEFKWNFKNLGKNPKLPEDLINDALDIKKAIGLESVAIDFISVRKKYKHLYNDRKYIYIESNSSYGIGEFTAKYIMEEIKKKWRNISVDI